MAGQITPDEARTFAKTIADLYGDATLQLLRIIATRMAAGLDVTDQRAKLADLLGLRNQARKVAQQVSDMLDDTLADTITRAYDDGQAKAVEHLSSLLGLRNQETERRALQHVRGTKRSTVEALARSLAGVLRDMPIARAVEDAYRSAIVSAIVPASAGVETRRQATQRALDRLAIHGVTGFRDRSGRRWAMDTYAEMATRSTLAHASLQGSIDRIRQTTPFVKVSDVADECERCRPWEGEILLTVDRRDWSQDWLDRWGHITAKTLREAVKAGLFHPNCTHGLGAYIPGLSRHGSERPARENPQGYADRQEQRRLERGLREWKRREAVAIDDRSRAYAAAKVAEWSQRLAEHVAATNRNRLPGRETTPVGRT